MRHWRSYSLSGPEGEENLTITVQEVEDGIVSRKLVRDLPIGTIVQLEQAAGEFLLPDPLPSNLLFVTAGSGITPVMGMLRTLDRAGTRPDVTLVHSAPTPDDVIFGRELAALAERWPGLRVHVRHTRADGRLYPADVDALVPDRRERLAYACGPAEMLDALEQTWDALRVERFSAPLRSTGGTGGSVRYGDRAVDVEPGTSLLEAGEEAGVLMPSGCRMGICFGCVLPLRDGQVRDLRTGEVHGEPGDLVQTCISGASGDAVLDTDPEGPLMTAVTTELENPVNDLGARPAAAPPDPAARPVEPPRGRAGDDLAHRRPDRGAGPAPRRDPRPGPRRARRQRRRLHPQGRRLPALPGDRRPRAAVRRRAAARVDRRHRHALDRQDPREHGDRAQRDARPVGLDA